MRILVGCEKSGRVRDELIALGHNAISCDILPSDTPGPHYQGDLMDILYEEWDMGIFFPPCTHLAVSGAKHFAEKRADGRQQSALDFVKKIFDCKIKKKAIENPVSIISTKIRKPDQIIHPYYFGDPFSKTTCIWLENLPHLKPTKIVDKGEFHVTKSEKKIAKWIGLIPPGIDRADIRSKTFPGVSKAMAMQWAGFNF